MTADNDGRTRWLLAGQALLRRGGVRAVKLDALCEESGLTTGSFYHHFRNAAAYRDALADYFGTDQVEAFLATADAPDPHDRIRQLVAIARDESMAPLDAAMRDWAGSDDRAAAAVRATDAALTAHLVAALRDMGHDEDAAAIRAFVLLATGATRVEPPATVDQLPSRILDLVTRPD